MASSAIAMQSHVPDKYTVAKELFFSQPDRFPYDTFSLEDVILPPGDDLGVESDADEVTEQESEAVATGFGSSVAVDGLPVVPEEKFDKLQTVLRKRFACCGDIKDGCYWMPTTSTFTSKGFSFMEFSKPQEALAAVRLMDQHALDKSNVLRVHLIDELDRLDGITEEFSEPGSVPFHVESHSETMAWMMDKRGRDQMLLQHGQEYEVTWNDPKAASAEPFFARSFWSEGPMMWSPLGSYAVSLHRPGVALWTSKADGTFERITRFQCPEVQKVDFSAFEEYLTCYSVLVHAGSKPPEVLMTVFDCRSGRKLRTLQDAVGQLLIGSMKINSERIVEPFLQWSPNTPALAAKLAHNAVQVFQGSDMTLLGKQSITLEGVQDIKWSPEDNILAVYQQEHKNMPARVAIVSLPDKTELRQKNLFMVQSAKLYWHPQGKYLAVHTNKYTKSKKTIFASVELFCLKDKGDVTNDVLELSQKNDKILQVAWEPKGDRFAVVHAEQNSQRASVSFFSMLDKSIKESAKLLGTITNRPVSQVHWSPAGKNILLAGLDTNQGALEFFNVDDFATLRPQAHFLCNNIKWDQTGRYVATWVDDSRDMEHGFIIWSFTGEMLYRSRYDSFWSFSWRPRPTSQLPTNKEKEIVKNLKLYAKRYEEQDEQLLAAADTEQLRKRHQKLVEWDRYSDSKRGWKMKQHEHCLVVLGTSQDDFQFEMKEMDIQQVVDVKEELYIV